MRLNEKGLNSLAAFLRNCKETVAAVRVETRNSDAIAHWQEKAFQNAEVRDGKLINCGVEVGFWNSGVRTHEFDLSEVDVRDDEQGDDE